MNDLIKELDDGEMAQVSGGTDMGIWPQPFPPITLPWPRPRKPWPLPIPIPRPPVEVK